MGQVWITKGERKGDLLVLLFRSSLSYSYQDDPQCEPGSLPFIDIAERDHTSIEARTLELDSSCTEVDVNTDKIVCLMLPHCRPPEIVGCR